MFLGHARLSLEDRLGTAGLDLYMYAPATTTTNCKGLYVGATIIADPICRTVMFSGQALPIVQ